MFNKKKKQLMKEQRQEEIKALLTEVYNAIAQPEYGRRYNRLRRALLEAYQVVDAGKWDAQCLSDVVKHIQHMALRNYKVGVDNPPVFSEVRPKLEYYIGNQRPLLGLWIYH
ncbi:hypothetical protein OIT44_04870 [Weissella ceti]|uniref:Bacteriocin immunity protein n=1 Tax=Weissella ceti TaxID=759620 RepID=A0ABT3E4R7_9LACO|nr:hypothetical protein [Weissella ceti]MCW0953404.1 hypothetical protein [Weissella ceti]QVK12007.1 hypothetical protein KHQ31_07315 [Weissella ceti]